MKKSFHITPVLLGMLLLTLISAGCVMAQNNLAPVGVATASGEASGYPASNLNDGDMGTYWLPNCADGTGSYIQLNWATPQTLTSFVIREQDSYTELLGASVQAYIDGAWQDVTSWEQQEDRGVTYLFFRPISALAFRVVLNSAVGDSWAFVDIAEVEAYNNLAMAATPSSSGYGTDYGSGNYGINDGAYCTNMAAWWADIRGFGVIPSWVQLTWPDVTTFNTIIAHLGSTGDHPYSRYGMRSYELQTSIDGSTWTRVKTGSAIMGMTNGSAILRILLPNAISTRYLRMRFSNHTTEDIIMSELEVYDTANPDWATITGKVSDATSGEGVAAQMESESNSDNPLWKNVYDFDTDASGNFSISVEPGTYTFNVRGPGYATKNVDVTVGANETKPLDVSLTRGSWTSFPDARWSANTDLTENKQGFFISASSAGYSVVNAGPTSDTRPCVGVPIDGNWLGWSVDSNYFHGRVDKAWVTITYFDQGTGSLVINQMHDYDPAGISGPMVCKTNTGKWITRTVPFDMTYFIQAGYGYDFWVTASGTDPFYIASLSLSLQKPADYGKLPLSITFDATPVGDGIEQVFASGWNYPLDSYITAPVTIGDKIAHQIGSGTDAPMALNVDTKRLMGLKDVWLSVEYYDSGTDWLGFQIWDGPFGALKGMGLQKTGSNTWKTWTIFLPQMNFNDANGCDVIIQSSDGVDWIRNVTISETKPVLPDVKIGDIRNTAADGTMVMLSGKVSTFNYGPWCYWIEEPDRSSGIRVNPTSGTPVPTVPGTVVTVSGRYYANWNSHGPTIDDAKYTVDGSVTPLAPLAMINKNFGQTGLNISGLLVKVWGKVISKDGYGGYTIEDGSGNPIYIDTEDRAAWDQPAPYVEGVDYVLVTGIAQTSSPATVFTTQNQTTKL